MTQHNVKLVDGSGNVLAFADVTDEGAQYGGTIDLGSTPPAVRALFAEFDEIVNGQMFSFLDEIHDKIDALNVTAEFADGRAARLHDLQVYPSTGDVSFKVAEIATLNGAPIARPQAAKELSHVGGPPVRPVFKRKELAAWTMLGNLVLNLDEVINR